VCTADDGQRNWPKYVEFYSKNKFEKLVHLVGFIIRAYVDINGVSNDIARASDTKHPVVGLVGDELRRIW